MKKHASIFTHATFEAPGAFLQWFDKNNWDYQIYACQQHEIPDSLDNSDLLLVMGGPQSPNDRAQLNFLANEIALIQEAKMKEIKTIGVCLGAQLLAVALGGDVTSSPHKEIGGFPLQMHASAKQHPFFASLPDKPLSMHWHGDMPVLTNEMTLLASSEGCPHQIYSHHDYMFGFQNHFEFTLETTKLILNSCPEDLIDGPYIQTPQELLAQDFTMINQHLYSFLDRFLA